MPKRGGPGGDFPLDSAFDDLRKVAEFLGIAFIRLEKVAIQVTSALEGMGRAKPGAAGAAASSRAGKPGGAATGAQNIGGVASEADKAAKSLEKAATAGEKFDRSIAKVTSSLGGMQRTAKGIGDIAEVLGFDSAAKKANDLAKVLGGVRDIIGGISAARGVLIPITAAVVVALSAVGGIQAGIKAVTGETLSLTNTISAVALGLDRAVTQSIAGWRLGFNDLADGVIQTFTKVIQEGLLRPTGEGLREIANVLKKIPAFVSPTAALAAAAADAASDKLADSYVRLGARAEESGKATEAANKAILDSMRSAVEGIDVQINKLFDEAEGDLLFTNPIKAIDDLIKKLGQLVPALGAVSKEAKETADKVGDLAGKIDDAVQKTTQALLSHQLKQATSGAEVNRILNEQNKFEQEDRQEAIKLLERQLKLLESQGAATSRVLDLQERIAHLREIDQKLVVAEEREAFLKSQELINPATTAGVEAGTSYRIGFQTGLEATEIQKQIHDALFLDKDGEIIDSFRNFFKNIERLFKDDPFTFITSALGGLRGQSNGTGPFSPKQGAIHFADGGEVPGSGATDSVPAMLMPGEVVESKPAVGYYGKQFMLMLNSLRIPRGPLLAAASLFSGGFSAPATPRGPGVRAYAAGGEVSQGSLRSSTMAVQPVMLANELQMETFLHGGSDALTRWLHQNGFGR